MLIPDRRDCLPRHLSTLLPRAPHPQTSQTRQLCSAETLRRVCSSQHRWFSLEQRAGVGFLRSFPRAWPELVQGMLPCKRPPFRQAIVRHLLDMGLQVSDEVGRSPQDCEALYKHHSLYLNLASQLIQKEAFMGMVRSFQEHSSQARQILLRMGHCPQVSVRLESQFPLCAPADCFTAR